MRNEMPQVHRLSLNRRAAGMLMPLFFAFAQPMRAYAQGAASPVGPAATQPPVTPAQLDSARREGEALGANQGGWFGRAYAVGFLGNLIGTAIIVPVAAYSEPTPPVDVRQRLLLRGPEYQAAFEKGYTRTVRRKRVWTSLTGALLGTITIFALFVGDDR